MFEFEDSKLGRVKILNVTEARSSIASIMNDMEFNYIITKNNKPIRVIINYDSYKKTKNQLQPQITPKAAPKAPEIKNTLSGLIGTREKELKSQIGQVPSEPMAMAAAQGQSFDEEPTFIMPEEDTTIEPISLETPADPTSEIYWTGDEEETQVNFEEVALSHEKEPLEAELPKPSFKQSIYQPAEPSFAAPTDQRSEESPDYFARYKKLYQEPEEPIIKLEEPVETSDETWVEPILPEEELTLPVTEEVIKPIEPEPVAEPIPEEPVFQPEPIMPTVDAVQENTPPVVEKPARHREVPSIQDLLRDLENEKLSGDDE